MNNINKPIIKPAVNNNCLIEIQKNINNISKSNSIFNNVKFLDKNKNGVINEDEASLDILSGLGDKVLNKIAKLFNIEISGTAKGNNETFEDLTNDPIIDKYMKPLMDQLKNCTLEDLKNGKADEVFSENVMQHTFESIIKEKSAQGVKVISKDKTHVEFDDGTSVSIDKIKTHSPQRNEATFNTKNQIKNKIDNGAKIVNVTNSTIEFDDGEKIKLDNSVAKDEIQNLAVIQIKKDSGVNISNIDKNTIVFDDGTSYQLKKDKYNDDNTTSINFVYTKKAKDGSESRTEINTDTGADASTTKVGNMSITYINNKTQNSNIGGYNYTDDLWTSGNIVEIGSNSNDADIFQTREAATYIHSGDTSSSTKQVTYNAPESTIQKGTSIKFLNGANGLTTEYNETEFN